MKYRTQAHATYKTLYHIVWIPKRRRKVLVAGVSTYLEKVMDSFNSDRYPDVLILERSVQVDHIHLLAEIPPKYAVSKWIGDVKAHTSRIIRKEFDYLRQYDELWSIGYFVSTVGLNQKIIEHYIQNQEKQDAGRDERTL